MFWGDMKLSDWPCFTWKFFVIRFHKFLNPRNIFTKHWRKLPNVAAFLEIFSYLKNNGSVDHV